MGAADLFREQYGVDDADKQWTVYSGELTVNELLVGGVPNSPSVIRGWLQTRLDLNDAALEEMVEQIKRDRADADQITTSEDAIEALMNSDQVNTNGFVRDENGQLCYLGRQLKAALKESVNVCYPGTEWPGKDKAAFVSKRKGLMSTFVERVFVVDHLIGTGVKAEEVAREYNPGARAWVEERVKRVQTPQGERSAITRVEVIHRPTLSFTVKVADGFLPDEAWARIWGRLEEIGIGADRARSDGRFNLTRWDRRS